MIITRLSGGLGNQMFQYAIGRALSLRNNTELVLDISSFTNIKNGEPVRTYKLDKFNISGRIATKNDYGQLGFVDIKNENLVAKIQRKIFRLLESLKPISKRRFIIEKGFEFDQNVFNAPDNCLLSGVWQNEKYFKDAENIIKNDLTLNIQTTDYFKEWSKKIENCNSISINIRRTDYVNNPKFYQLFSSDYYDKTINYIKNNVSDPIFFVTSDDTGWVKNNIKIPYHVFYMSDKKTSDYEEIILMSKCRHNIIANSSFGWWGAWLNTNKSKIVIAPKKWFGTEYADTKDLIPKDWVTI